MCKAKLSLILLAFTLTSSSSVAGDSGTLTVELYKKIRTGNLSVISNLKPYSFKYKGKDGKISVHKTFLINTHGSTTYGVDIKDGLLVIFPHLHYKKRLRKTFTDVIGYATNGGGENPWLFVSTVSGEVFLFQNLTQRWTRRMNSSIFSQPSAFDVNGDGKLEFLFGDDAGVLHCITSEGKEIFTQKGIKGMITGTPIYDSSSHLIFAGASDGRLYAISMTGGIKWKMSTPGEIYAGPVFADFDSDGESEIVLTNITGEIYLVRPEGKFKKIFQASYWIEGNPALADLNGDGIPEIIVGSWDNHVYAITYKGKVLWKFDAGSDVRTTPVVADINNDGKSEITVATDKGKLFILNTRGEIIYERKFGNFPLFQPSVFDADGDGFLEILVGSGNRTLYVFKTYSRGSCEWPLYRRDTRNSGRYAGTSGDCP